MQKSRVIILGGGFGGVYAALEFEKLRDPNFDVTLILGILCLVALAHDLPS